VRPNIGPVPASVVAIDNIAGVDILDAFMRLHSLLLYLYPSSFRSEYGREIERIFEARRRQASTPSAIIYLWIGEFLDIVRDALRAHLDILNQDLSYTLRTLGREKGFALTAVLVTGLGIGANTAVFSLLDRVLFHPFPFLDLDRVVQLMQHSASYSKFELSPPNFYDWRRLSTSFESMSAYTTISANFVGQGDPKRIGGARVTPEFFRILDARPLFGRTFTDEDARDSAERTTVLSYTMWQTAFGGTSDVLGSKIRLEDNSFTVIGIMPRDFFFPTRETLFWTTLILGDPPQDRRDNLYLSGIGRLKRGVGIEKARAEMNVIAGQLAREYPKENDGVGAAVDPLDEQVPNQTRLLLWALFGASACVLLIACSNLANLLLARAMGRRKELAVRTAIGAGRERLVRQLLTESLVLAFAGGVVGIVLGMTALPLLVSIVPSTVPFADASVLSRPVFAFAAAVTLGTGLGFGVLPAMRICRVNPDGLREGSRSGVGGRKERLRSTLVVAEIMASVVLLVSSGVLLRALWRVQSIDAGFQAESVIGIQTWLPMPRYGLASARNAFYDKVLSSVRAIPGVFDAAYISSLPMEQGGGIWPVSVPGTEAADRDAGGANTTAMRIVTPGYFDTMGIPLRAGRDFRPSDDLNNSQVAIVSEAFVRKYWPNQNPIGRTFHFAMSNFDFAEKNRVVIGVVGDVRFRGLERQSEPQVYLAYRQLPDNTSTFYAPRELVIRSSAGVQAFAPSIRQIIKEADPELPISAVRMLKEIVDRQTAPRSTQIRLIGAFAALSLVLAGIGIHGLLSFTVGQRLPEFGLRIALGAQGYEILSLVLREGIVLAVLGTAFGLALSYYAGRSMQALLAGVSPFDPASVLIAAFVALTMTLSGSVLPAVRAMQTDPTIAIRGEG